MRILYICLLLLNLVMTNSAHAANLPQPTKLAPHSYAWIGPYGPPTKENKGFRMNLGFVVGNSAVAVIDSGYSDAMAKTMLKQIKQLTSKPVRYVINTNSQPHRILGNAIFKKNGASLIASSEAIPRIKNEGTTMARSAEGRLRLKKGSIHTPALPERIVNEALVLDLGGVKLNVIPAGHTHTAGSLIVEVADDNVVYAGDILYGGRLLAILPVSRVDKWIQSYDKLRKYQTALFVPGHGEPAKLNKFEHSTYQYLTTLKTHMDNAISMGLDLNDALRRLDQSAWQGLADFDNLAGRNAHQTYLEREMVSFE